jgi:hypothetical protein
MASVPAARISTVVQLCDPGIRAGRAIALSVGRLLTFAVHEDHVLGRRCRDATLARRSINANFVSVEPAMHGQTFDYQVKTWTWT